MADNTKTTLNISSSVFTFQDVNNSLTDKRQKRKVCYVYFPKILNDREVVILSPTITIYHLFGHTFIYFFCLDNFFEIFKNLASLEREM